MQERLITKKFSSMPTKKPPRKYQRVLLESEEAQILVQFLRARGLRFCHVPNEAATNPIRGAKLKREGVAAGFPDYIVFLGGLRVCFIELKRTRYGRVGPMQKSWIEYLKHQGFDAIIAAGAVKAIQFIESLLLCEEKTTYV